MRERGYPVDDFDQRANDISVEHPRVVENYREARRVRDAQRDGSADTEDLRGAVTSYRSLVEALLEDGDHGDGDASGRHRENGHRPDGQGRADTDHEQTRDDDRSRR